MKGSLKHCLAKSLMFFLIVGSAILTYLASDMSFAANIGTGTPYFALAAGAKRFSISSVMARAKELDIEATKARPRGTLSTRSALKVGSTSSTILMVVLGTRRILKITYVGINQ